MRGKISRLTVFAFAAILIISTFGCGGAGTKKAKSDTATPPSLSGGQTIIVSSGSRTLQPSADRAPTICIIPSSEAAAAGDTLIAWGTPLGIQGSIYNRSKSKTSIFTLVSTEEGGSKASAPRLASMNDGKFAVLWKKERAIMGKYFLRDTSSIGKEVKFAESPQLISIATQSGNRISALYEGFDRRLYLTTVNDPLATPETVSVGEDLGERLKSVKASAHYNPTLAIDTKGNILATWGEATELRGNLADTPNGLPNYGTRIGPDNKSIGSDIRLDKSNPPRIPGFPASLGLKSGWVVATQDTNANEKSFPGGFPLPTSLQEVMKKCESNLYVTFWNEKGEAIGAPVRVDSAGKAITSPFATTVGSSKERDWEATLPGMARDKDGNVFIVWTDFRSGYAEVYGRILNPTGTQLGSELKIGEGWNGRVAFDGTGFQVVWTSLPAETSSTNHIYLRTYTIQE